MSPEDQAPAPERTDARGEEQSTARDEVPSNAGFAFRNRLGALQSRTANWLSWKKFTTIALSAVGVISFLANLTAVTDLGGRLATWVSAGGEEQAIEEFLIRHYEDVGPTQDRERLGRAFSDFSEAQQEQLGGRDAWIENIIRWCPSTDSEVESVKVNSIEGDDASATVDVHYIHTCDAPERTYETESHYVWDLIKQEDGWKLDTRDPATVDPVRTTVPVENRNGAPTESTIEGKPDDLRTVRSSATALSLPNDCGQTFSYEPEKAVDGKRETAWHVAGNGKGQWLLLEYEKPTKVSRVGLVPGYDRIDSCDGLDRFYQLYVVREARIETSGGYERVVRLDRDDRMQEFDVPDIETSFVKITILDTYPPGSKPGEPPYPYTSGKAAISEVEVTQVEE